MPPSSKMTMGLRWFSSASSTAVSVALSLRSSIKLRCALRALVSTVSAAQAGM